VDIAEGQLEGDKKAAAHYGYQVKTIQGDMSNFSALKNNSFDLVYQPPSMAYVPEVKKVYAEVARVLRKGGLYRVDAQNPLAQFIDETSWDGKGYRVSVPYAVKEKKRAEDKNVIEYRHTLEDAFNGLLECDFTIEHVQEAPPDLYHTGTPKPDTWAHSELYLPGMFTILAKKR
jgi:ubiquinone/menaquinone biosynthesis C-methylase UbiE